MTDSKRHSITELIAKHDADELLRIEDGPRYLTSGQQCELLEFAARLEEQLETVERDRELWYERYQEWASRVEALQEQYEDLRYTVGYVEGVLARDPFDETQRQFARKLLLNALGGEPSGLLEQLESEQRKIAWMTEALRQTTEIARQADMPEGGELGRAHIVGMLDRIEGFSLSKLARWLGWAQAAVVASGAATLEDMKRINMECSARADSFPASEPEGA